MALDHPALGSTRCGRPCGAMSEIVEHHVERKTEKWSAQADHYDEPDGR